MKQLNKDGLIHVVPARVKTHYIIRFTVTSYHTTENDIKRDWNIISTTATKILKHEGSITPLACSPPSTTISSDEDATSPSSPTLKSDLDASLSFQSSLLLSNVPQTPKVVNASFLAFFPTESMDSATLDIVRELSKRDYAMSHLPLKPRRKPKYLLRKSPFERLGMSFDEHGQRNRTFSLTTSLLDGEKNDDELGLNKTNLTQIGGQKENTVVNGKRSNQKYT